MPIVGRVEPRCRLELEVVLVFWLVALASCRPSPASSPGDSAAELPADLGLDSTPLERPLVDGPANLDKWEGPPYPIVLAHGFFGFKKIGPIDYFYDLKPALLDAGHRVFITVVDPFNSVSVRGEQLLSQVMEILAQTRAAKVNIIGHSQGGLDARYVASRIPERIGAVVTIATPHMGCKVADVLLERAPGFSVALAQAVCALLGRPFWGSIAKDPDLKASLESISSAGAAAFNAAYPDAQGVSYFSIGGRSNKQLAEEVCEAPKAPPFIARYATVVDPIDPTLVLTAAVLSGSLLHPAPNDGMVNTDSTKWGTWLGCIPADHMDEIGQFFGDSPGSGNSFDYVEFYKDLCVFLAEKGF